MNIARRPLAALSIIVSLFCASSGFAQELTTEPGRRPAGYKQSEAARRAASEAPISQQITMTGLYSWSIDGIGTTSATGTVTINKPVGATVHKAYLMSATVAFKPATVTVSTGRSDDRR